MVSLAGVGRWVGGQSSCPTPLALTEVLCLIFSALFLPTGSLVAMGLGD